MTNNETALVAALGDTVYASRRERKRNSKLTERLNRIANLMPGRRRIWQLDSIAMLLSMDADAETNPILAARLDDLALYARRLEHDLTKLRDAVRGDQRMRGTRFDPTLWIGKRP